MSNHLETHLSCAVALYGQFREFRIADWVERKRLADMEQRIRDHISGMLDYEFDEEDDPKTESFAFISLAAGMFHANPERRKDIWRVGICWLSEGGHKAIAARSAMVLFPLPHAREMIHRAYMENPDIRADLIDIWSQLGFPVPKGLLNQGELQSADPRLQVSVMRFLARNEDADDGVFAHYYEPLVRSPGAKIENPRLLEYAILGGLIRGDEEATVALRRALERDWSEEMFDRFLRLAALTGSTELFPVLRAAAENPRWPPLYLLALHGDRRAFDILLAWLKTSHMTEYAANAWFILTGHRPRRIPRMSVVGEGEAPSTSMEGEDQIPDIDDAISWLAKHSTIFDSGARILHGYASSNSMMLDLMRQWSGKLAIDLADMLAISLGTPVSLATEGWFAGQALQLENLKKKMPREGVASRQTDSVSVNA